MTVGVPPKQSGLLTGQRFYRPGRTREVDLVGVAPEMFPAVPEEMFAASTSPPPSLPFIPACRH